MPSTQPKAPPDAARVFDLSDIEVRASQGSTEPRIVCTAAVYNKWSSDLGGFKERILPGAFTKTLEGADVRALFNHDSNIILGRNKAGTLTLTDSASGLKVDITPPDTQTVRDLVMEPMRRGDINQMSFAFRAREDEWREPKKDGGLWERDVSEVELFDVSVVVFPAYSQTDVALRALTETGGLNILALSALLTRASRGLTLTTSDIELIDSSVSLLRSYAPEPPTPDEGAGKTPDEGAPVEAVRSVAHLRALLAMEAASVLPPMG